MTSKNFQQLQRQLKNDVQYWGATSNEADQLIKAFLLSDAVFDEALESVKLKKNLNEYQVNKLEEFFERRDHILEPPKPYQQYPKAKESSDQFRTITAPSIYDRVKQRILAYAIEALWADQVPQCFHAFLPSRGVNTAIKALRIAGRWPLHFAKIDIDSFFDEIPRREIFQDLCVPSGFKKCLKRHIYAKVENPVQAHNRDEKKGLYQGLPLSPILAMLYIRNTPNYIGKCGLIGYADDFFLYAKSEDNLNHGLNRLKSFFCSKGLNFKPGKSDQGYLPSYGEDEGLIYLGMSISQLPMEQPTLGDLEEYRVKVSFTEKRINKVTNRILEKWEDEWPVCDAFIAKKVEERTGDFKANLDVDQTQVAREECKCRILKHLKKK